MGDDLVAAPDPRIHDGICGYITVGGTGLEWICVREPHLKMYRRHGSRGAHEEPSTAPDGDRHYFVQRWPNRERLQR